MNNTKDIVNVLHLIAERNDSIRLNAGLSEDELQLAERLYGFHFPPDLREVLSEVLPIDALDVKRQHFPNWREVPNDYIQMRMNWPFEMLIWDVEHNWRLPGWPKASRPDENSRNMTRAVKEQPQLHEDLKAMTRATLDAAPRLIPLYSHRFLPATPCESGNPVFSMHGTDTIIYGTDLLSYFCNEFKITTPHSAKLPLKKIPFWSALAWDD